jgi:hypothetical protein
MTAADFRKIALSLDGVEEYSHAGLPDKEGQPESLSEIDSRKTLYTAGKLRMMAL